MRPHATHVTYKEGGTWIPWGQWTTHVGAGYPKAVHAIKFSDGSEWDCINGWRENTIPNKLMPDISKLGIKFWDNYDNDGSTLTWWTMNPKQRENFQRALAAVVREVLDFDARPPGPTASTSTPNSAPSSESDTPTASTSSARQEAILLAAQLALKNLDASFGWSLNVVHEPSNMILEVSRPTPVAPSNALPTDHRWNEGKLERFSEAMQKWVPASP